MSLFKKTVKELFVKRSYSQSGEDLIMKFIFDTIGINKPSYIDIGAHHPFHINNTAIFYKLGSRGINIEPNPESIKLFKKSRQKDINLNIGIGLKEGNLDYYKLSASSLNTFSKEAAEEYQKENGYKIIGKEKIKISTLKNIIEIYHNGIFPDFLSLDVEGMDDEILHSINYKSNYPIVICVETISFSEKGKGIKNDNIISFLEQQGYIVYADTYINTIFVKKNKWENHG